MNTLTVTPRMLSTARTNKCVGWLTMNPLDFLRLTTETSNVFDWIRREEADKHSKTLADYNKFAQSGDSIHMPWLDVDIHTGRVVGHEGRHRAMAVYNADGKTFPVAICLRERGYAEYYRETKSPDGYGYDKVFLGKADCPKVFVGQFVHKEVSVNTDRMVEFWASENKV